MPVVLKCENVDISRMMREFVLPLCNQIVFRVSMALPEEIAAAISNHEKWISRYCQCCDLIIDGITW